MFARFDENPAMTLRVIKETKRYGRTNGRTHGRTHGQRENSIPPTNKVCGGYNNKNLAYPYRRYGLYTVNSEFFERILFSRNSFKRHICDAKKSQLVQDLPILVNDRVISPFCEGFIFMKLGRCEDSRK